MAPAARGCLALIIMRRILAAPPIGRSRRPVLHKRTGAALVPACGVCGTGRQLQPLDCGLHQPRSIIGMELQPRPGHLPRGPGDHQHNGNADSQWRVHVHH